MANDSVGVAAAASPTNYIDNESISTGGSPATVDRQRVRVGGAGYTDLADVVSGDTGQSSQVVAGARKEISYSTTTSQAVAATDCSNYRSLSLTVASVSNSVVPQVSNDNSTWFASIVSPANTTASPSGSLTSTGIWTAPCQGRYIRLNVTVASGTTSGLLELFSLPSERANVPVYINGPSNVPVNPSNTFSLSDGTSTSSGAIFGQAHHQLNGTSWDRVRVPTTFKTATATASGDTALWTPTTGKKFRLMRYMIEVTSNAAKASGGLIEVVLRDSTTALGIGHSLFAPSTAITTYQPGDDTGWVDLGNGILSAAANNVLNINLSAALSSGEVRVICCGTEE